MADAVTVGRFEIPEIPGHLYGRGPLGSRHLVRRIDLAPQHNNDETDHESVNRPDNGEADLRNVVVPALRESGETMPDVRQYGYRPGGDDDHERGQEQHGRDVAHDPAAHGLTLPASLTPARRESTMAGY
ncbi:hypothetical protein GCM10009608_65080 [Pseudonocardia alaniniphila]